MDFFFLINNFVSQLAASFQLSWLKKKIIKKKKKKSASDSWSGKINLWLILILIFIEVITTYWLIANQKCKMSFIQFQSSLLLLELTGAKIKRVKKNVQLGNGWKKQGNSSDPDYIYKLQNSKKKY